MCCQILLSYGLGTPLQVMRCWQIISGGGAAGGHPWLRRDRMGFLGCKKAIFLSWCVARFRADIKRKRWHKLKLAFWWFLPLLMRQRAHDVSILCGLTFQSLYIWQDLTWYGMCDNLHPGEVHLVCPENRKCLFRRMSIHLNKNVQIMYYNIHHILLQ